MFTAVVEFDSSDKANEIALKIAFRVSNIDVVQSKEDPNMLALSTKDADTRDRAVVVAKSYGAEVL